MSVVPGTSPRRRAMRSSVDRVLWILLASCLVSSRVVDSQRKGVGCPSGCDAEKCQCSEDEGLFVVCEGLTESFSGCLGMNVIEFQLHNSTLTTLGPSDFREVTTLEKLDITGNSKLATIEEHAFGELTSLRQLFLDHNVLTGLQKPIFPTDSSLEEIRLNNNEIATIDYDKVFAGLRNSLKDLRLGFNKIKEFVCPQLNQLLTLDLTENELGPMSESSFDLCPNVTEINLSGNLIRNLTVNWTSLPDLHTLNLNDNEIEAVGSDFQRSLPNLKYLLLNFNQLPDIPPLPTSLLGLELSGNRFETIRNSTFEKLTRLTFLGISDVQNLTSIEEAAFAGLESLVQLSLSNNRKLSFLPPNPWPNSRDLMELRLEANNISVFHRSLFEDLDSLWAVQITGNPIHCSCENSWIRAEMDSEDNPWIRPWKNGSHAVDCLTPDNLEGFRISQLNAYDLTCNVSYMQEHSVTMTSDGAIFQAVLVEGVPSTSWYLPDGRRLFAHRQQVFEEHAMLEEILWENLTILARLTIASSGQSLADLAHGEYVLEWTNAAGSANFTFTISESTTAPPPHGGGSSPATVAVVILSIGMIILLIVGGFLVFRYLRSRRQNPYNPAVEDAEDVPSSEVHLQNEPESSSLYLPSASSYGSTSGGISSPYKVE